MDHEGHGPPQVPTAQPQPAEASSSAPQPEHAQAATPPPGPSDPIRAPTSPHEESGLIQAGTPSGDSNHGAAGLPQGSSVEQPLLSAESEGYAAHPRFRDDSPYPILERPPPPPPRARSRDELQRASSRRYKLGSNAGMTTGPPNPSELDYIVPRTQLPTIHARLGPTIKNAEDERNKFAKKALWTNYILNIAIGMQVVLGALTTGISAGVTTVKQGQISTAILGGLSTLVASYLARARGSGEPELSISRVKDLEHFLRDCRAFDMDHGHECVGAGHPLDHRLQEFRRRLEEFLGNASGERKFSPVGITANASHSAA